MCAMPGWTDRTALHDSRRERRLMMKYLISPDKKQYKANLHCHSVLSDGNRTPEELKALYKSHGYSILAITDHERPRCHQDLTDPDFMMITGYECYIRPDREGHYDPYNKEVHLNLFALDPKNVTMICYNEAYCKYLRRDNALNEITARKGSERPREYSREYIDEYIRTAKENGYIVAYNHPYWSMEEEADIIAHEGCFSMEICNYGSYVMNGLEYCGALYDKMLCHGKRIFCHGADDNHNQYPVDHPHNDSFGAFTMIMPEAFTYDGVTSAMQAGEMYASMGPLFRSVSIDSSRLHVECSDVSHIYLYNGGKRPGRLHAAPGESLTGGDFDIDQNARYIRVSVQDARGRWADTRGFFRDEIGFPPLGE